MNCSVGTLPLNQHVHRYRMPSRRCRRNQIKRAQNERSNEGNQTKVDKVGFMLRRWRGCLRRDEYRCETESGELGKARAPCPSLGAPCGSVLSMNSLAVAAIEMSDVCQTASFASCQQLLPAPVPATP